jgi:hypothetical protein
MKYFLRARGMIDVTDCRDLVSLQTIIFMIIFLQSSVRMARCYSLVGLALSSSLRMGLHRSITKGFNPVVQETRKRAFWVVRKLDTYVGVLLGLPKTISDDDIDQDMPEEVDDQYITPNGILPMPPGHISIIAATNAHTRLLKIVAKIMRYIYPIKGMERGMSGQPGSYAVSLNRVRELERDLRDWKESLPAYLTPGFDSPPAFIRAQHLLRMSFAHAQMMIYRPFLHYVDSRKVLQGVDPRSYTCGAMCINVARNIVHITDEMNKRGLLNGAYWFNMYTTFFAILSLVFYVLQNPGDPGTEEIWKDAEAGKQVLADLADRSLAAARVTGSLATLWTKIPDSIQRSRDSRSNTRKKRQAPTSNLPPLQPVKTNPDLGTSQPVQTFSPHKIDTSRRQSSDLAEHARIRASMEGQANRHSSIDNYTSPGSIPSQSSTPLVGQGASPQEEQAAYAQQLGGLVLPDLSAMMFPTQDPFAYPKNPTAALDNLQFRHFPPPPEHGQPLVRQNSHHGLDPSHGHQYNLSSDSPTGQLPFQINRIDSNPMSTPGGHSWHEGSGERSSMEAQVFGPMPTYLVSEQNGPNVQSSGLGVNQNGNPNDSMYGMTYTGNSSQPQAPIGIGFEHGQPSSHVGIPGHNQGKNPNLINVNNIQQTNSDLNQIYGLAPNHQQPALEGNNVNMATMGLNPELINLEDIFTGDDNWADILLDPNFRQAA